MFQAVVLAAEEHRATLTVAGAIEYISNRLIRGETATTNDDWYELHVPALHMASLAIILWVNAASYGLTDGTFDTGLWYHATLAAAVIVLVTEMRIRKDEVARTLRALLDAKKGISDGRGWRWFGPHEIRVFNRLRPFPFLPTPTRQCT